MTITRTLLALALLITPAIAADAPVIPGGRNNPITVVDGDTVDWQGRRYRLMGLDAPETHRAQCQAEKSLGDAATWRLQFLISGGGATIQPSGHQDRYGRELGRLTINGRDAADILIGEGLARPYRGGRRKGWCGD